jgi:type I restriction enzyme M protein
MDAPDLNEVKRTLWAAADEMRANSTLGPAEYRGPVLGLIFLAYAEHRFEQVRPELEAKATARRPVTADDYKAKSVLYVPDEARLSNLAALPEATDLGAAADAAMRAIEEHNPELKDVLPKGYRKMEKQVITSLLRLFAPLPRTLSGDAFGLIYEDFLSNFAAAEGKGGGEFFTPYSIVRLIVEILEPFNGRVFDPSCGSGGMFVQCGKFVERRQGSATADLSVYGQEQKEVTVPLAKMNLALHGLSGQIALGNSYYDDIHQSVGKFDFVMANPPFNVNVSAFICPPSVLMLFSQIRRFDLFPLAAWPLVHEENFDGCPQVTVSDFHESSNGVTELTGKCGLQFAKNLP